MSKTSFFYALANELRVAWNSACPFCDSRSRHRGLALLLPDVLSTYGKEHRLIHIAPEPVLVDTIKRIGIQYFTTDLFLEDVDFRNENLERLSFAGGSFDVVLCNHVLEHVRDDVAAVSECARILTNSGLVVFTIPGEMSRHETIVFPNTDINGHYRDYGNDVGEMFKQAFGTVEMIDMSMFDQDQSGLRYGIRRGDTAFVCRGPRVPSNADQFRKSTAHVGLSEKSLGTWT